MKLIVGLGNPGASYVKTRHNIGRRAAEYWVKEAGAKFKKELRLKSLYAEIQPDVTLAVPDLYMNESGKSVALLVNHFQVDFKSDLLILIDDAALPFGRLRLRAGGQDGGHKGLRSIEAALGSKAYARLRIGIAPSRPVEEPLEEYVLNPFEKNEEKELESVLERAAKSCRLWLEGPLQKAMNWTNAKM